MSTLRDSSSRTSHIMFLAGFFYGPNDLNYLPQDSGHCVIKSDYGDYSAAYVKNTFRIIHDFFFKIFLFKNI
jgi:hypothetical protein